MFRDVPGCYGMFRNVPGFIDDPGKTQTLYEGDV